LASKIARPPLNARVERVRPSLFPSSPHTLGTHSRIHLTKTAPQVFTSRNYLLLSRGNRFILRE
jgi:hypothetical protein